MKTFMKILILAAVLISPLGADDLPVITLEEALMSAESNNTELESARITLNKAVRNADNVMGTFMPTLSLEAGLNAGGSFPPAVTSPAYTGLSLSAGANASFSFDGSMAKDGERRKLSKEYATLSFLESSTLIEQNVISAYWTIAAYSIQAESARTMAEDARTQYQSILEMYDSGIEDELTLNQTELALNEAELTVKTAEDTLINSKEALKVLTGITGDFDITPLPETVFLTFPDAWEIFNRYGAGSLSIRQSRNSLSSAETELDAAKLGAYVPTIRTNIAYSYGGGWDSGWVYGTESHRLSGGVTVTVPLSSILPGGTGDSAVKDAEDDLKNASVKLRKAQDDLLSDIRDSVMRIGQYQDSMAMAEKSVSTARRTYELMTEAFDAGITSASDLASARTDLLTAELNALSYDVNQLLESYKLAYLLGISLEELQAEYGTEGER